MPTTNSRAKIEQRVASTNMEVVYNRPSVKGRVIFGQLVPFDQIWRTGADASTKITFSTPVSINGNQIAAGTFELFTIPSNNEWTIILQESKSQWGSYSYNPEFDVVRFAAKPLLLKESVETFTIGFDNVKSNSVVLTLSWEKTRIPIEISVDLKETVVPQLEASLLKEGRKPYFQTAMFYFENNLDINRAAELMELATQQTPNHLGMLYRQALIIERKGDIEKAMQASNQSYELAQSAERELKEEYSKLNTALLSRLKK